MLDLKSVGGESPGNGVCGGRNKAVGEVVALSGVPFKLADIPVTVGDVMPAMFIGLRYVGPLGLSAEISWLRWPLRDSGS